MIYPVDRKKDKSIPLHPYIYELQNLDAYFKAFGVLKIKADYNIPSHCMYYKISFPAVSKKTR